VGYRRLAFDGGTIEYLVTGPQDAADLLLFHMGTPSAAVEYPGLTRAAAAAGLRVATYSRAGYGASTRRAGRSVADEVAIATAIADALGHPRFFTIGSSGGSPVALACAALAPDRVRACVAMAGIAPWAEAGPVFETFVPPDSLPEWRLLAANAVETLTPAFEDDAKIFRRMTARRMVAVGGLPDARARANGFEVEMRPTLIRSMRRAVANGVFGYLDDALAHARDWGFRVADIRVPVVVRHGELDRLVSVKHARWLAQAIPGVRAVILPDAGHGSIALPWKDVVDNLLEAAR
jgi:pimeloyl-ACP methyl ester carboxylesterase